MADREHLRPYLRRGVDPDELTDEQAELATEFIDTVRARLEQRQRAAEWLDGKDFAVVTREMVAERFGVPVDDVAIIDGSFEITLRPITYWSCTLREVPVDGDPLAGRDYGC